MELETISLKLKRELLTGGKWMVITVCSYVAYLPYLKQRFPPFWKDAAKLSLALKLSVHRAIFKTRT
jgi:hypothetical protein